MLLLWSHMFKAIPDFVVSSQNSPLTYKALTMTKELFTMAIALDSSQLNQSLAPCTTTASTCLRISHGLSLLVIKKTTLPLTPSQVADEPVLPLWSSEPQ